MRAVRTNGTGKVAGVRLITLSSDTLFWFQVDSTATSAGRVRVQPASAAAALGGEGEVLPAWAQAGKPLFPAHQLPSEDKISRPGEGTVVAEHGSYFDLKSKAWASLGRVTDRLSSDVTIA